MSNHTLILFVDTNLFIQCHPLEQLDWSDWKDIAEIRLMVCRPVQREIDNQKNAGNNRVGRRSRATHSLFRSIAESGEDSKVIRKSNPTVKLYLESLSQPSPELKGILDYTKTDDEIVGCLHRFIRSHPESDARLLTHDGGPMMTARDLELPFTPINDNWLLSPEPNQMEKQNARLTERVAQLERAEPKFRIELVDGKGEKLGRLDGEFKVYEPLPGDDLQKLMQQLSDRFPVEDDFGPLEQVEEETRGAAGMVGTKRVYTPASSDDITTYTEKEYPKWIKDSAIVLMNLHKVLQFEDGQPIFTFAAYNEGTRPGANALVQITACGNFRICPPPEQEDETEQPMEIVLRLPPTPPKGRWDLVSPQLERFNNLMSLRMGVLGRFSGRVPGISESGMFSLSTSPLLLFRDPNEFDYKRDIPTGPVKSFALECEQWRHQTGPKYFAGRIFPDHGTDEIRGALRCEAHAQNLSAPVHQTIPVRITIKKVNTKEYAKDLVQNLIDSAT